MNAWKLYSAIFDEANEEYAQLTTRYVRDYAANAWAKMYAITDEVAQKILDCRAALIDANAKKAEQQNNMHHHVQSILEVIEI